MIFKGSRYEGSRYTAFIDAEGNTKKYVHPRVPITINDLDGDFRVVKKTAGDELDSLAVEAEGRERLWWVIAEVSGIQFAFDIPDGTDLAIPSPAQFSRFK